MVWVDHVKAHKMPSIERQERSLLIAGKSQDVLV
jgi:hypothetical protein